MGEQSKGTHSGEIGRAAGSFFVISLGMIIISYSIYYRDEFWGLAQVAVSTAAAVMLLLSGVFSVFGETKRAKVALGGGMVGLFVWPVLIVIKMMQYISEHA
ncbi:MAG: hypothetical protein WBD03_06190 [Thermoplasmata archaeon]